MVQIEVPDDYDGFLSDAYELADAADLDQQILDAAQYGQAEEVELD